MGIARFNRILAQSVGAAAIHCNGEAKEWWSEINSHFESLQGIVSPDPQAVETLLILSESLGHGDVATDTIAKRLQAMNVCESDIASLSDSFKIFLEVEREFKHGMLNWMRMDRKDKGQKRLESLSLLISNSIELLDPRMREVVSGDMHSMLTRIDRILALFRADENGSLAEALNAFMAESMEFLAQESKSQMDVENERELVRLVSEVFGETEGEQEIRKMAKCMQKYWYSVFTWKTMALNFGFLPEPKHRFDGVMNAVRENGFGGVCDSVLLPKLENAKAIVMDCYRDILRGDGRCAIPERPWVALKSDVQSAAFDQVLLRVADRILEADSEITTVQIQAVLTFLFGDSRTERIAKFASDVSSWHTLERAIVAELIESILPTDWSSGSLNRFTDYARAQSVLLMNSLPLLVPKFEDRMQSLSEIKAAVRWFAKKWENEKRGGLILGLGDDVALAVVASGLDGNTLMSIAQATLEGLKLTVGASGFDEELEAAIRAVERAKECENHHARWVVNFVENIGDLGSLNSINFSPYIQTKAEQSLTVSRQCSDEAVEYLRARTGDPLEKKLWPAFELMRASGWFGLDPEDIDRILDSQLA